MPRRRTALALALLLTSCAHEAPPHPAPKKPAPRRRSPASRPTASEQPAAPRGGALAAIAVGRASFDCLEPRCLAVEHLPALAKDGAHLAFVTPCPFVQHLAGNASTEHFLRFEVVRADTGAITRSLPLITPAEIDRAAVGAKAPCTGTGACDPHLGPDDPKKKKKIAAAIARLLTARVGSAGAILRNGGYRGLKVVPKARFSPAKGLFFRTTRKNSRLRVQVLERPAKLRFSRVVHDGNKSNLEVDSVAVWIDHTGQLLVVRVVSWNEGDSSVKPQARYTVGRI